MSRTQPSQPAPQPILFQQAAPTPQPIILQSNSSPPPKHDIHKFHDIKPHLGNDNWITWKCNLLTATCNQGLYRMITGIDLYPVVNTLNIQAGGQIYTATGNHPVSQIEAEWDDRNNAAYNQIITCLTPELRASIDHPDQAADAWKVLIAWFKSHNPNMIAVIRAKYENYHMVKGQPVSSYIMTLTKFRVQLKSMGQDIEDSYHSSVFLWNLPESWCTASQMIGMVTTTSKAVEQKLIANEANMTAFNLSLQGVSAFSAQLRPSWSNFQRSQPQHNPTQQPYQPLPNWQSQFLPSQCNNRNNTCPQYSCNKCGRQGHSAAHCFAPGGGLARQPTSFQHTPPPTAPQTTQLSFLPLNGQPSCNQSQSAAYMQQNQNGGNYAAHLANIPSRNIVMMAKIIELPCSIEPDSTNNSQISPDNDPDVWQTKSYRMCYHPFHGWRWHSFPLDHRTRIRAYIYHSHTSSPSWHLLET